MRTHVPETGWFPVVANGLTFACLEWGSGPLMLLVHGFPDTPHTWDELGPRFAALGYRVVAPFTRGYAPTEIPEGDAYSPADLGGDVVALIEALGAESAVVVGHDWGALAAYAAVHLAPERVDKLVTIAIPHPLTLKPDLKKVWGARHFVVLRLPGASKRWVASDKDGIRKMYERWSPGFEWPDSEFEAAANAYAAPGCAHAALGYYRCFSPSPPPFMKGRIDVDTLVVGGLTDGVATAVDFERSPRRFKEGRCEVKMLPGGHFLHREHPDPFFEAVKAFLGA